jgi:tetratricopeptide (TPR) repeat protein
LSLTIFRFSAGFLVAVLALLATSLYLSDYFTGEQQRLALAGDEAGAMKASRMAVRLDPFDTDALQAQSLLWRQKRNYERATLALREAIGRDPNNYLPYLTLANLRLMMGEPDAAVKDFREVLELNPGATQARSALARTLMRQGKLREAGAQFETLKKERSASYQDLYDLGRIQVRTGEALEGVKNIKRARRMVEASGALGPQAGSRRQLLVSMNLAAADALVVAGRVGRAQSILAQSPSEQAPGLLELLDSDPEAYREQVINSDVL